jgi:enoyl-CoA hydratase/carnithine racemase
VVGLAKAKELILTGEIVDAAEAERIALVNRVAPAGTALEVAMGWAETIASRGPVAVREAKSALDVGADLPLDEGLAMELEASERVFASEDMLEGARAFFEKRQPKFSGK